jgi:hypothetical protein
MVWALIPSNISVFSWYPKYWISFTRALINCVQNYCRVVGYQPASSFVFVPKLWWKSSIFSHFFCEVKMLCGDHVHRSVQLPTSEIVLATEALGEFSWNVLYSYLQMSSKRYLGEYWHSDNQILLWGTNNILLQFSTLLVRFG